MAAFDFLAEPDPQDILWIWVNTILPPTMDTPWGYALSTFTSTLTFLGSLLLGYFVLIGIVSSAYSGKVLGERYHQIWAPLRIVFGFGLLIPIDGGFSSVHHILRDVIARSAINIGNAPIVAYVDQIASGQYPITPYRSGGSRLVVDILEHEVCLAARNRLTSTYGHVIRAPNIGGDEKGWGIIGNPVLQWDYGSTCGAFSFQNVSGRENFSNTRMFAVAQIVGAIRPTATKYAEFLTSGDPKTTEQMMNGVQLGVIPDILKSIREIGLEYDRTIVEAARRETEVIAADSRARMIETIKREGLMAGGEMWLALAQISNLSTSLTNEETVRTTPRFEDMVRSAYSSSITAAVADIRTLISGETQLAGLSASDLAAAGDDSSGILTKIIGAATRDFMEGMMKSKPTDNAMADIVNTGQWLKFASKSLIITGIAAEGLANNIITKNIGAGGAVSYALEWVGYGIVITYILGVIRADLFPLIPFLMITIMGAKWIASVLSASIATPLWSFAFIRLDGHEFIDQKQAAGVTMLLDVMLRPALSVLALIASYPLFNAVFGYIDSKLVTAYLGNTGGTIVSFDNALIFMTISTFLMMSVGMNLFGLIGSMSDKMYPWLGVQAPVENVGAETVAMAGALGALGAQRPHIKPTPKKEAPELENRVKAKQAR